MKQSVRATMTFLAVPLALLLFTACSKKAAKPPEPGPNVTQDIRVTKPPRGGTSGGGSVTSPGDQSDKLLALRGEDIKITEEPKVEFGPLSDEDKLIVKNVYFDYDRSSIKPQYQPILEGIAGWLNDRPDTQLLIEGHCDERGTNEYNLALGERRALSVRRFLVGLGISPNRLHTLSYGEEQPADSGHDESAWSKNRRASYMKSKSAN